MTEDQEVAIRVLIAWLQVEGKTREEIRAAVEAKLDEWDIERPERGLAAVLTDEQEAELKTLIEGLKESDTSREEIRAAGCAGMVVSGAGMVSELGFADEDIFPGPQIQDNLSVLGGRVFALPLMINPSL